MSTPTGSAATDYGSGPTSDAAVNASNQGNNTVIAAVAGKRIVVLFGDLIAAGAVTVTIQSSGGTVLDGPFAFAQNGGKLYPESKRGHFSTPVGEGLVINLSGGVQVGGHLKYALT